MKKSSRFSSDLLEIPVHLLPANERNVIESRYCRKGSVNLIPNDSLNPSSSTTNRFVRFSNQYNPTNQIDIAHPRRCSDFITSMSNVIQKNDCLDFTDPSKSGSGFSTLPKNPSIATNNNAFNSLSGSQDSFLSSPPTTTTNTTKNNRKQTLTHTKHPSLALHRHQPSTMSFEIDAPIISQSNPSSSTMQNNRRSSKSLEFSTLQFADENRQETIPETVMEQFEYPSPCKAAVISVIPNGEVDNFNTNVNTNILIGSNSNRINVNNRTVSNQRINRAKYRLPSFKSKFGSRFSSISKSESIQHSIPTINQSTVSIDEKSIQSVSNSLGHLDNNLTTGDIIINNNENNNDSNDTNNTKISKRDVDVQFNNTILHDTNNNDNEHDDDDDNNSENSDDQLSKPRASSYLKEQFFSFFQPSDNKLALKLFGNKNAVNKEKRRQQQQGKLVIHPCSNFRFYWDLMMLVLLITNLIVLPVAISFFNDDLSIHWIVFNCFSDTIFILDIAVNFRTGIITNDFADEIILDPKVIARHYMKSWFVLDLLSSIPMDYLFLVLNQESYSQFLHAGRTLRIFRLAKLLSMLRLLRLSRLVRYVSQWEEFLNMASKFMGICKLVLLMLLLGHWNACLQFLIPMLMDYPAESWVIKCDLKKAYWFKQYTWALFKAMSHMLSIGYGRFPPTSISEAWITIVSMMTGATCYALFVGHAAAIIQSFDTSKRLYREKFKQVEEYMAYRKLPRALRQRIANYYEHRYQGKMFDEDIILLELSECLREQIINYNCRALVAAVPFFTYADQDFVSEVVTKLRFEVYQPGDLIIKEGTIGTKMYFIQEGIVDIITKDGEVATSLSDGSYFGEICLLTNAKRVASVRAETYCNLYSLDSESFSSVLENYPLMRRTMESVAAERLSKIGQNPQLVSSREDLKEDLNLVKEIVSSVTPMASDDENGDHDDDDEGGGKGCDKDSDTECPCNNSENASSTHSSTKKQHSSATHNHQFHHHHHHHHHHHNHHKKNNSFSIRKSNLKQNLQNVFRITKSKSNLSFSNVLKTGSFSSTNTENQNNNCNLLSTESGDRDHRKNKNNRCQSSDRKSKKDDKNGDNTEEQGLLDPNAPFQILITPSDDNRTPRHRPYNTNDTNNDNSISSPPPPYYSISDKESCL